MSDGPHRSLPMKPRWKRVADRAFKPAFSMDQVGEAAESALRDDWRAEVSPKFRQLLTKAILEDGALFADQALRDLGQLRRDCASPLQAAVVDEVRAALEMGLRGSQALEAGVAGAFAQRALRAARQIEEHVLRKVGRAVPGLRARLESSLGEGQIRDLARGVLTGSRRRVRLPKREGLEEGPRLS